MILSDLLGRPAYVDGDRVGWVIDVRLRPEPADSDQPMPTLRAHGLIVSPHSKASTLGYERSTVRSPRPIAALQRWRHRETFLVPWADVAGIEKDRVTLRPEHHRYSPELITSASSPPNEKDFEHRSE
jgi:hypothetical protein